MEWQISTRVFGANILWQFSAHPYLQTIDISNSVFTVKINDYGGDSNFCPPSNTSLAQLLMMRRTYKNHVYSGSFWRAAIHGIFAMTNHPLDFHRTPLEDDMLSAPPASKFRMSNASQKIIGRLRMTWKGVTGYIEDGGQQIKSRVQLKNPWIFCPVRHLPICRFLQLF